ncbi:type IV pilus modification protein PilV [Bisbaumannia pacifica]|uniref:Type IV pilus modification protein PilV n=1 Tax=Bisbaumannia pacifica TaxID=77098 RepID=A0ABD4L3W7_9GAMM|nr:type IV pilus modification protein PilV [Halomonas pacifica]MBH8581248.1 type IV pilus modification protein PilV [Halomonas pacifica]
MSEYKSHKDPQGGFTLLEALIAVLVLSFGLLGVAAMQLKAVQSSHLSYHRSIATLAAQDASELLWYELDATAVGSCPDALSVESDWDTSWSSQGLLPGFSASSSITDITVYTSGSPDNGCDYEIRVAWQEERFAGESVSELVYVVKLPVKQG